MNKQKRLKELRTQHVKIEEMIALHKAANGEVPIRLYVRRANVVNEALCLRESDK